MSDTHDEDNASENELFWLPLALLTSALSAEGAELMKPTLYDEASEQAS